MNTDNKQPPLPYVSYPTFKAFISHLHDTVVTDIIDYSMMPKSFSGSAKASVTSALKSLRLIDDENNATQDLKDLAKAYNTKEWPEAVKNCILSAYDGVSGNIDLKTASKKQLEGVFENTTQQVREKCIRFFLTANREAGIEYSPHLKIRKRSSGGKRAGKTTPKRKPVDKRGEPQEQINNYEQTPSNMFDQPIPIVSGSFIRIPRNITISQFELVKAAVAFIEAMAKQNEAS